MLQFQLFRLKLYQSKQVELFEGDKPVLDILKETIISLSQETYQKDKIWHIGNIIEIDKEGIYLRIGKTTKSKLGIYKDGMFIDQDVENSPYTHVILDLNLEICAIAGNQKLSPKIKSVANRLTILIKKSTDKIEFEINEINDPEEFLDYLKKSYNVSKFLITFSLPNPFDANDFIKPMQKLLKDLDAKLGKTELKGDSLKTNRLEDLARSAASTGDDAVAHIQMLDTEPIIKKHLKGNPVLINQDDVDSDDKKFQLLRKIREIYHKIRNKDNNND